MFKGEDLSVRRSRGSRLIWFIVIGVAIVGGFTIGILIGRFATCPEETQYEAYSKAVQEADPAISDLLIQSISAKNIEDNLK